MFDQSPEINCCISFGQYFYNASGIRLIAMWDLRVSGKASIDAIRYATSWVVTMPYQFRHDNWAVVELRCALVAFD